MIAMCKPDKGLTVSRLLDYILEGEKHGLTRFLEAAVEFCAYIDFDLLNGKKIYALHYHNENKEISLKFSKIQLNTRYAILKARVHHLEMYKKFPNSVDKDYTIALS